MELEVEAEVELDSCSWPALLRVRMPEGALSEILRAAATGRLGVLAAEVLVVPGALEPSDSDSLRCRRSGPRRVIIPSLFEGACCSSEDSAVFTCNNENLVSGIHMD